VRCAVVISIVNTSVGLKMLSKGLKKEELTTLSDELLREHIRKLRVAWRSAKKRSVKAA
jgi:hypothetical protein